MGWPGPMFTDSGGYQVFSLGFGKEHGIGKMVGMFPDEDPRDRRRPRPDARHAGEAEPRRRRRRDVPLAPRRLDPPPDAGVVDRDPGEARRRRHPGVRRADLAAPRRGVHGAGDGADPPLGRALAGGEAADRTRRSTGSSRAARSSGCARRARRSSARCRSTGSRSAARSAPVKRDMRAGAGLVDPGARRGSPAPHARHRRAGGPVPLRRARHRHVRLRRADPPRPARRPADGRRAADDHEGAPTARTTARSIRTAPARPARRSRGRTCGTCSSPRSCWRTRWRRRTTWRSSSG